MLKWLFGRKGGGTENKNLPTYEQSRSIAEKGSAEKRAWLASCQGLQPEFLYLFATDEEVGVRKAVAANEYTPLQADKILATDENEGVRIELAEKVTRLMPTLDPSRSDKVAEMVLEIVSILAEDRAARVRQIVAEEIKSLENVPGSLVEQLAWDAITAVSAPVLEFSPLLSERQLVEIIRSGIDGGALDAVARRHGLSKSVSSEIVEQNVGRALVCLLENTTAEIAEEGYVTIADTAKTNTEILEAMIERDDLTLATIRRVATFVGNAVIDRILERNKSCPGLDDAAVRGIRQKVHERVMSGDADDAPLPGEEARQKAEKLYEDDKLTEDVIAKAIKEGDRLFAIHSLALLASLPWDKVRRILNSQSGKTIAALCWKAGISAERSVYVQKYLARLTGSALVHRTSSGDYAMSEDELAWYMEFFD